MARREVRDAMVAVEQSVATPETVGATVTRAEADRLWSAWLRMWNEDPQVAHDIIGPGYLVHLPAAGATIDPSSIRSAEAMAGWVAGFTGKFDNLRYHTDFGPLVDGDKLVVRWIGTATYRGLTGWPRDVAGRPVTMVGVDILRIADGRIVECWTQGAEA
jgi:hypothetical protein